MKEINRQPGVFCLNRGWKFKEQDYSVLPEGKTREEVYGFSKGGAALGPASRNFDDSGWESAELPEEAGGPCRLAMVIRNTDAEFGHAGLCCPAVLRKE